MAAQLACAQGLHYTCPFSSLPPLPRLPRFYCSVTLLRLLRRLLPFSDDRESALVDKVLDGDSIRLVDGREVRYLGIDAPETRDPNHPEWRWAQRAHDFNARLVAGRRVTLRREQSDRDHYGRLLRHVYVGRTWVNGALVARGLARARAYPPDDARAAELEKLQTRARRRRRGVWGWSWRRR